MTSGSPPATEDTTAGPGTTAATTDTGTTAGAATESSGSSGTPSVCGDGVVEGDEECESAVDLCVDCRWEPGNDHACIAPRVLVLSYDTGHATDVPVEADPDHMSACLARDMREATRFRGYSDARATPFVRYQLVDSIRVDGQAPQDVDSADYGAIYADHDICARVDAGEIDEVWMWGDSGGGYPEWVVTGSHFTQEWGTGAATCSRQLATMGFNYTVSADNDPDRIGFAIHSIGHRIETTLSWLFEGTTDVGNTNGGWYERFDGQNHRYFDPTPPLRVTDTHCGNVHYPPNTIDDYTYDDAAQVESDCMDWSLDGGESTTIDATTWGCPGGGAPCLHAQQRYLTWWMQNIPAADHPQGNWWKFLYESDMGSCEALTEVVPADCTELGDHGSSRYVMCPAQSWEDGLDTCRDIGEGWDLVATDDMDENAFVAEATHALGTDQVWLGLNDRYLGTTVPDEFVWTQCVDTTFTYFDTLEPNGFAGEDCVELNWVRTGTDGLNGHWNDLPCSWELPIVCEGPL